MLPLCSDIVMRMGCFGVMVAVPRSSSLSLGRALSLGRVIETDIWGPRGPFL